MPDLSYVLYGRIFCPQCKVVNWWYAGCYPVDETYPDTDALRCHQCQHVFLLIEKDLFEESMGDTDPEDVAEDGLPEPRP